MVAVTQCPPLGSCGSGATADSTLDGTTYTFRSARRRSKGPERPADRLGPQIDSIGHSRLLRGGKRRRALDELNLGAVIETDLDSRHFRAVWHRVVAQSHHGRRFRMIGVGVTRSLDFVSDLVRLRPEYDLS